MNEIIRIAINNAGYLYFLTAPVTVWLIFARSGVIRWLAALIFAGLSVLAYSRFIEPRMLLSATSEITLEHCFDSGGEARIALFSDTHIGPFRFTIPIERIAGRVNSLAPDAVFIAGDFVSYLPEKDFDAAFAPFGDIEAPVYAVLGNHDHGMPGPDVAAPLRASLERSGVIVIDDKSMRMAGDGYSFELIGVSDLWAKNQNLALFDPPALSPRIALTHNAETILKIAPAHRPELMFAGHTHGGQIYLPFITCRATFACAVTRQGYKALEHGAVFVTSGTGQSVAPMRFLVPPRIDLITLRYPACDRALSASRA